MAVARPANAPQTPTPVPIPAPTPALGQSLRAVFISPHLLWTMISASLEACASVSALLLLVQLVNPGTTSDEIIPYLGGLFLALALSYLFQALSTYVMEAWRLTSIRRFTQRAAGRLDNQPANYADHSLREQTQAGLVGNSSGIISGITQYTGEYIKALIHLLATAATLAHLISAELLLAFAFSLAACIAMIRWSGAVLSRRAEKAERHRLNLGQSLGQIWDNLTLGNQRSRNLWHSLFQRSMEKFRRSSMASQRWNLGVQLSLIFLAHVPALVVMTQQINSHLGERERLLALLITVPGLIRCLNLLSQFAAMSASLNRLRGQLQVLGEMLKPLPGVSLESHIQPARLSVYGHTDPDQGELARWAAGLPSHGRVLLQGENGSGKSTLLLFLKQFFGARAYLLPAKNELLLGPRKARYSTGERVLKQLDCLLKDPQIQVLLLDEWDANLDLQNRRRLSMRLDQASTQCLIVEVRHNNPVGALDSGHSSGRGA